MIKKVICCILKAVGLFNGIPMHASAFSIKGLPHYTLDLSMYISTQIASAPFVNGRGRILPTAQAEAISPRHVLEATTYPTKAQPACCVLKAHSVRLGSRQCFALAHTPRCLHCHLQTA
jgi:hypothetical protein